MDIKVLGPGCPKCQQTEKAVKEAPAPVDEMPAKLQLDIHNL